VYQKHAILFGGLAWRDICAPPSFGAARLTLFQLFEQSIQIHSLMKDFNKLQFASGFTKYQEM
jgi:hypothetical protein